MGNYCELPQVEIGKFCSIVSRVTLAESNHPIDYLSTSPYTYSTIRNSFTSKQLYKQEFFILTRSINIFVRLEMMYGLKLEQYSFAEVVH